MPQPVIEVSGLVKHYGKVVAVDGIDFSVPAGATVALLGGNGAGKTTTLSMLLGLLLPTAGQIRVLGEDMLRHRHRVLARMNFSSPYVDLPHRLTVRENLTVYAMLYGIADRRRRIEEVAEDLAITALLKRKAGALSAGQKTRVALAKAMLNRPEVLLLDEPTASLDPDTGDWVRAYLERYRDREGGGDPARLPQYGRGGAALQRGADDAPRPDRRSRRARRAGRALRPQQSGGGLPRHRPRTPAAHTRG